MSENALQLIRNYKSEFTSEKHLTLLVSTTVSRKATTGSIDTYKNNELPKSMLE